MLLSSDQGLFAIVSGNLYCQYVLQCYYGVTIVILCMFVYKVD